MATFTNPLTNGLWTVVDYGIVVDTIHIPAPGAGWALLLQMWNFSTDTQQAILLEQGTKLVDKQYAGANGGKTVSFVGLSIATPEGIYLAANTALTVTTIAGNTVIGVMYRVVSETA